jgi:hypothetical protein
MISLDRIGSATACRYGSPSFRRQLSQSCRRRSRPCCAGRRG